jgi:hypothetical protein
LLPAPTGSGPISINCKLIFDIVLRSSRETDEEDSTLVGADAYSDKWLLCISYIDESYGFYCKWLLRVIPFLEANNVANLVEALSNTSTPATSQAYSIRADPCGFDTFVLAIGVLDFWSLLL